MYPDRKTSSLFKPVNDLTAKSCSSLTALESLQQHETNPLIPPLRPIADEFVVLLRYAVPIIGTHLLENTLMLVSMVWVGHLGTTELAAMSLANMTLNCSSLSVVVGFASALEGLCSQAYTSEGDGPHMSTLAAFRTTIIVAILVCLQSILLWNILPIFCFLRVDPVLAVMAARALRLLLFALPGYATFEISRRWLQAQAIISLPTAILLLISPLNAILSYLFICGPKPFQLGFMGAPMSTVISFNLMGFSSLMYSLRLAIRQGKPGWIQNPRVVYTQLGPNFWDGLSGFATLASEWWFWEFIGFASAHLGHSALAAHSIVVTITTVLYQLSSGAGLGVAARCGNLVGAGRTRRAVDASWAALMAGVVFGSLTTLFILVFRYPLARLFSSQDEEVTALVGKVLPTVAMIQIPDSIRSTLAGVIRGAGEPKASALMNCVGYYILGLPMGLFLSFSYPGLGLLGLWLGMLVAVGSTTLTSCYYLFNKLIPSLMRHPEQHRLIISNPPRHYQSLPEEIQGGYGTLTPL
ncbi:hypothetical protein PCANC_22889 [Puccinia coronata f. sp. avenae]|uniref:MATE efflux family protein n=1 Tax=Puccinia coronata f. sp. avenae TaxID=200324 RepID=A0A2N5TKQ6_9BASI|nr:hypothetical protein PCASD_21835 [Puccinia coronata f. sp. avenae]PLW31265.1 hypothetical protein PCANC_22889 [Puccinia coronata f. sp. avenae]